MSEKDYQIEIKVKNARVLRLMEREGIATANELARRAGVRALSVGAVLNMKMAAYRQNGEVRTHVDKICKVLRCLPEDLFPPPQLHEPMKENKRVIYAHVEDLAAIGATMHQRTLPPDKKFELEDSRKRFLSTVKSRLNAREYEIIDRMFGISSGEAESLEKISKDFGISNSQIVTIKQNALRKLKHPVGSRPARDFLTALGECK
jgi:DNA-directed RNA polymerase sigma subunit (sigma70/sigma32)